MTCPWPHQEFRQDSHSGSHRNFTPSVILVHPFTYFPSALIFLFKIYSWVSFYQKQRTVLIQLSTLSSSLYIDFLNELSACTQILSSQSLCIPFNLASDRTQNAHSEATHYLHATIPDGLFQSLYLDWPLWSILYPWPLLPLALRFSFSLSDGPFSVSFEESSSSSWPLKVSIQGDFPTPMASFIRDDSQIYKEWYTYRYVYTCMIPIYVCIYTYRDIK